MPISPTAEGFRATLRRPSFTFAEIAWRWVVGGTALALFFFGLFEYLNTLPVTSGEMLFLRSRQPYLVAQAIAHILRGGWNRAVLSLLLAALLVSLLWMVAASLGRIATVRALVEYFRSAAWRARIPGPSQDSVTEVAASTPKGRLIPLVRLNFLRVALGVATILGLLAADIIAGFASPAKDPQPGLAFMLFLPMAVLILLVGWALNWFLSVAGMFAVRDDGDSLDAISSAVGLCRERTGAVLAVSSWTGLAHLVVFVGATTIVSMVLGFAPLLPWRLILLVVTFLTTAYFAVVDWLYMARLAGYVCIVEAPDALLRPTAPMTVPPPVAPPVKTAIDRDELILSDLPHPVTG